MNEHEKDNEQIDLNGMKELKQGYSERKEKLKQALENIKTEFAEKLNKTKETVVSVITDNPQKLIAMASLLTIGASVVALEKMDRKHSHIEPTYSILSAEPRVKVIGDEVTEVYDFEPSDDKTIKELENGIVAVTKGKQKDTAREKIDIDKENAVEVLSNDDSVETSYNNGVKKISDEELDKLIEEIDDMER